MAWQNSKLKYKSSPTMGCKDVRTRKSELEAKA